MTSTENQPKMALIATLGTNDFKALEVFAEEIGQEVYQRLKDDFNTQEPARLARSIERLSRNKKGLNSARYWGKKFLELPEADQIVRLRARVSNELFPILKPALEFNLSENRVESALFKRITKIYLIATDNQSNPRYNDTIEYAEIIKQHFKLVAPAEMQSCQIEIIRLVRDAEKLDEIHAEVKSAFDQRETELTVFDQVYLLMTSGTTALITATLLAGSRLLKSKLVALYRGEVPERPAASVVKQLAIGRALYLQRLTDDLRQLVKNYEYSGALSLLSNNKELFTHSRNEQSLRKALQSLLEHAKNRLLFDLDEAEKELRSFKAEQELSADEIIYIRGYWPLEWQKVRAGEGKAHIIAMRYCAGAIAELYWHTDLLWKSQRFADYLARFKTLADRLNLFALELASGLPFTFEEATANQAALNAHKFEHLDNLYSLVNKRLDKSSIDQRKKDRRGNIPSTRIPEETGDLAYRICNELPESLKGSRFLRHEITQFYIENHLWQGTKANIPGSYYRIFWEDKSENSNALLDLLDLINDNKSTPLKNLTSLRNSLPPAHSFGEINEALILAASWDNKPPHIKLGEALEKLNCWTTLFEPELYVGPDNRRSPFVEINRRVVDLLNKFNDGV